MANVFYVYGPPGTGKTSRLATRDIPRAVQKYGSDGVAVAAFTRAAALEISQKKSRDTGHRIPVNPENVGTLHSLCFRGFKLAREDMMAHKTSEWNNRYPQYAIARSTNDPEEDVEESTNGTPGDQLLGKLNICRARMLKKELWPPTVRRFSHIWEEFKKEHSAWDFSDLIERAISDLPYAPNRPSVMFVDEAQDFTKLEIELVLSWAQMMEWVVMVGDDDQCIYRFKGADPENMRNPDTDSTHKLVLNQSWRVPRAVHARAMEVISRVKRREEKEYLPRDEEGEVYQTAATFEDNTKIVEEAADYIRQGKSVMFLASCSYMLTPLVKDLTDHGIPFSNRYRKRRGDWNPIVIGGARATAANVLSSFLTQGEDGGYWTVPDLILWASQLRVCPSGLKRKTGNAAITKLKAAIKEGAEGLGSSRNVLNMILDEEAAGPAIDRNIDWLMANIKPSKAKRFTYAVKVFKSFGEDILHAPHMCTVGTIHSVKGGEADIVYLSPDISIRAQEELKTSQEAIDAIHRLFYVGMTRARERLVILGSTAKHPGGFVKL